MMHLNESHDGVPKSNTTQIESTRDDGGAGCKCRRGEYELESATKARLILQLAEGSEREKD